MKSTNDLSGPGKLSEQHPREQGLKHLVGGPAHPTTSSFRATSKRTRIETEFHQLVEHRETMLSEQHPREQGLKPRMRSSVWPTTRLSEQHPREQGLKQFLVEKGNYTNETFRATSKRTRIETSRSRPAFQCCLNFQSNIQENKD